MLESEKYKSNLKTIRLDRGMTVEELAKGTGVAERTIKSLESENGSNPQLATIKRLMSYLEISFDDLYPHEY